MCDLLSHLLGVLHHTQYKGIKLMSQLVIVQTMLKIIVHNIIKTDKIKANIQECV